MTEALRADAMEQAVGARNAIELGHLERFVTHVPGLDDVLRGGLVVGGIYLIGGSPGVGKTTLANHIAFEHARRGGRAIFGTLLSESHSRLVAHLGGFGFFEPELVGDRVRYLSIYDELHRSGLDGALAFLRREVREQRATFLAIDGAGIFGDFAESDLAYRRFAYDLHAHLAAMGCTAMLLADLEEDVRTIGTHVDGIIAMEDEAIGQRDLRLIRVKKLRGVDYLRGSHQFTIGGEGVIVFPRLEAVAAAMPTSSPRHSRRADFGIAEFDRMLSGGLSAASVTAVVGAPGAGKTMTGLHFITQGARLGERGIILTFHETPLHLLAKARAVGLDLEEHVKSGRVRIVWYPPREIHLDEWAHRTLGEVAREGSARMFLDAVTDLDRLLPSTERLPAFFAAFCNELRVREVTTLMAAEQMEIVGGIGESGMLAATADNAILLRYVELRSHLHRLLSILKMRESGYDSSIREFRITPSGIDVADTFESAEAVLTGIARIAGSAARAG